MTGRVAVVTGGAGALGASICRRFLAAGATVCIPYVVPPEVERLRSETPAAELPRLHTEPADVLDEGGFGVFLKHVRERHRRVDVLVNVVGGFAGGGLASTSLAEWQRLMDLNLTSAVIGCKGVLADMTAARYGRIVNISSRAVVPPAGGFIAYTVAKAAVITLTQALAQEVRADGITVNAVLPSTMDTEANRRSMPDADRSGWVSPNAVAGVIALLASDSAGGITGAAIPI